MASCPHDTHCCDDRYPWHIAGSPLVDCCQFIMAPPPQGGSIKRCFCLTSVCLTSVAYIGRNSKTEKPRKAKIGTEVAHVTRDSDTTFKVKRSKVNLLLMSQK